MNYLFFGSGIDVKQTLDNLLLLYGFGDNLRSVFRLDLEIASFLRTDNDDRTSLTKTVAAGPPKFYLIL
jgi:hypothetical protein